MALTIAHTERSSAHATVASSCGSGSTRKCESLSTSRGSQTCTPLAACGGNVSVKIKAIAPITSRCGVMGRRFLAHTGYSSSSRSTTSRFPVSYICAIGNENVYPYQYWVRELVDDNERVSHFNSGNNNSQVNVPQNTNRRAANADNVWGRFINCLNDGRSGYDERLAVVIIESEESESISAPIMRTPLSLTAISICCASRPADSIARTLFDERFDC